MGNTRDARWVGFANRTDVPYIQDSQSFIDLKCTVFPEGRGDPSGKTSTACDPFHNAKLIRGIYPVAPSFVRMANQATPSPFQGEGQGEVDTLTNAGYEQGTGASVIDWSFWTREPGAGACEIDLSTRHRGASSLKITYNGEKDWSEAYDHPLPVSPGDILTIGAWVKTSVSPSITTPPSPLPSRERELQEVNAVMSVVTRRRDGSVIDWEFCRMAIGGQHDWQYFTRRIVIPADCATAQFRFTGYGKGVIWCDDAVLAKTGTVSGLSKDKPGKSLRIANKILQLSINSDNGTVQVKDTRCGAVWKQQPVSSNYLVTGFKQPNKMSANLTLYDIVNDADFNINIVLHEKLPQYTVTVSAPKSTSVSEPIMLPHPFVSSAGSWLVVPLNEGILYPVDDPTLQPLWQLVAYSGHGICMPWWGQIDKAEGSGGAGVQAIIETPNDASVSFKRLDTGSKYLYIGPMWEAEKGVFGYNRRITYLFHNKGGYVTEAKQYREYAKKHGLFHTLAEKRALNSNVDKLIGAANIWTWEPNKADICKEMKALGMQQVLWSSGGSSKEMSDINKLGYLTSKYDIYQDVWPPNTPTWLHEGWPDDLVWLKNGDWMKGWADIQKKPDGTEVIYQGGVISSPRGLARAKRIIPAELKTIPYGCRFIDTTTASPFREDYNPAHPLTRTQDRYYKMKLLEFCSKDMKLVTGSETGLDAAVPYLHYFEGMMSLGPYRLPDAGRDIMEYKAPTPEFLKYQVGHFYRIPLWELVYHDCVVSYWYWGDYNNKAVEVWEIRDLYNILYGTPPMYMFDKKTWEAKKNEFVQSYRHITPVARKLGYDEMVSHTFLTTDHTVQRTQWKSGMVITVNFGDKPYKDGKTVIPGKRWLISGISD